jgi:Ca2+:H+ antiporter
MDGLCPRRDYPMSTHATGSQRATPRSGTRSTLVVAPLLVLLSWALGRPMTLVFDDPLDLFAIAGSTFIVNAIAADGETPWFEGVLLIGVYPLLGLAFFYVA